MNSMVLLPLECVQITILSNTHHIFLKVYCCFSSGWVSNYIFFGMQLFLLKSYLYTYKNEANNISISMGLITLGYLYPE